MEEKFLTYQEEKELEIKDALKALEGKTAAHIQHDNEYSVTLKFTDGSAMQLWLDADCCSSSFFTDQKQFEELLGATVLKAESRQGKSVESYPDEGPVNEYDENIGLNYYRWHFLVFTTSKGHVTIDWRNDSNGYYDGTLVLTYTEPTVAKA